MPGRGHPLMLKRRQSNHKQQWNELNAQEVDKYNRYQKPVRAWSLPIRHI